MVLKDLIKWISDDYKSHPFRFCVETITWVLILGCTLTMALTIPNAPFLQIYLVWIFTCLLSLGCAVSRKSFGLIMSSVVLLCVDMIGLVRIII